MEETHGDISAFPLFRLAWPAANYNERGEHLLDAQIKSRVAVRSQEGLHVMPGAAALRLIIRLSDRCYN